MYNSLFKIVLLSEKFSFLWRWFSAIWIILAFHLQRSFSFSIEALKFLEQRSPTIMCILYLISLSNIPSKNLEDLEKEMEQIRTYKYLKNSFFFPCIYTNLYLGYYSYIFFQYLPDLFIQFPVIINFNNNSLS